MTVTRTILAALCAMILIAPAPASGAILVWPIDPVIEAGESATALWIENRGDAPAVLQMRVLAWRQEGGEDRYADQETVFGTPPMMRIEPGARQMIRLTRIAPAPAGTEQAFRILIDEIPTVDAAPPRSASAGIRFQLRYSIPLFAYGEGLTRETRTGRAASAGAARPELSWRTLEADGQAWLEVRNTGSVHARLARARFQNGEDVTALADGLFGYALAGSVMRRPLPDGARGAGALHATINGAAAPEIIPPAP